MRGVAADIRRRRQFDPLWVAAVVLAVVLPALAVTQYVWLTRLGQWQQRRTLQLLQAGADRLAAEFDDALEPWQSAFQMLSFTELGTAAGPATASEPGAAAGPPAVADAERAAQLASAWRRAAEKSPLPARELVRRVFWLEPAADGGLAAREFLPERESLQACAWPPELAALQESLGRSSGAVALSPGRIGLRLVGEALVLLVPHQVIAPPGEPSRTAWVALLLNRELLTGRLLPDLVRRYFAGDEAPDVQAAVVCGADPPALLYASEPGLTPGDFVRRDASAELLRARRQALLVVRAPAPNAATAAPPAAVTSAPAATNAEIAAGTRAPVVAPSPLPPQDWLLLVRHRAGSVEAWVRGARTRNLLAGAGILLALAASVIVLLAAAARARRLARLQMEFIRGVSHELRTPLAVISSAGENLADAVVGDPDRTREYGRMIHREGRRLGRMVDRVLQFARLRAEPAGQVRRSLAVADLIAEALETYRLEIAERGAAVRTEAAPDLPRIRGDREAVVAALENLISNALKYGGDAGEVTVRAAAASLAGRPAVEIAVSDRGPGIPESEWARVLEPFVRGRAARERQVKGSGLGLSLVRDVAAAHGGQVRIEAGPGGGARVVLALPAATGAEDDASAADAATAREGGAGKP